MDDRRIYKIDRPSFTEDDYERVSYIHDGRYLELFYNSIFVHDGLELPDHLRPIVTALGDNNIRKLLVMILPGAGKCCPPLTPVCTENGWKPIKDVKVKDKIFTQDGTLTTVLETYNLKNKQMYKLTFADGRSTVTSDDHLWLTYNEFFLHYGNRKNTTDTEPDMQWKVRTTKELFFNLQNTIGIRWYIPLNLPVQYPKKSLPMHPYLLGALLGESGFTQETITFTNIDDEIVEKVKYLIAQAGGELVPKTKDGNKDYRINKVKQIRDILKDLQLHDNSSLTKFIPRIYLESSVEDRIELLKGLMDIGGAVDKKKKTPSYPSSSQQLILDVQELARSLGGCAYIGEKKDGEPSYVLSIRHPDPQILFSMSRKLRLAQKNQYSDGLKLEIEKIEKLDQISDAVCLVVDHPSSLFIINDYIVTHNSQLINIAYALWELGLNQDTTILGISAAEKLLTDFIQVASNIIEHNPIFHKFFPNTIPDKDSGWSPFRGLFVQRKSGPGSGMPSPSYSVNGSLSRVITGKHAEILLLDDIEDAEISDSQEQIDKLYQRYLTTFLGRQVPGGSRLIVIGRRWAKDDVYAKLIRSEDWAVMALPAFREDRDEGDNSLWFDVKIPPKLSCVFNDYKATDEQEEIKVVYGEHEEGFFAGHNRVFIGKYSEALEAKKGDPDTYKTVYQSNPHDLSTTIFTSADFQYYNPPEHLAYGRSYSDVADLVNTADLLIQTWDTAYTAETMKDPSAAYTLALIPCKDNHRGEVTETNLRKLKVEMPFHYDVYVLDEFHGHLAFGDLTVAAVNFYNKWQPNYVLVEKSAVGIPLIDHLAQYNISVIGVAVHNANKRNRVMNGAKAGSAQGWFKQGRIWFPLGVPWLTALEKELIDFTGGKKERDDRVDALIHGINYAIDQGIDARDMPEGWRTPEEIDLKIQSWTKGKNPLDSLKNIMAMSSPDPFDGLCNSCRYMQRDNKGNLLNYCTLNKIKVSQLHSCGKYQSLKNPRQNSLRII